MGKTRVVRIKTTQRIVCQGMIDIGNDLIEIKKEINYGEWVGFLSSELGFTHKTAQRFMRVAREFGGEERTTLSFLESSKVLAILEIPSDDRDDFIEGRDLDNISVRELKAEIQKYKEENGLLTEKQQKALEDKRRTEQEKQRIQQELQREKSKQPRVETKESWEIKSIIN